MPNHNVNVPPQILSWLMLIHTEVGFRPREIVFAEVRKVLIDCSRDYGGTVTEDTDLEKETVSLHLVHPCETLKQPTRVLEISDGKD